MRKWADPRGGAEVKLASDALGMHQVRWGGANIICSSNISTLCKLRRHSNRHSSLSDVVIASKLMPLQLSGFSNTYTSILGKSLLNYKNNGGAFSARQVVMLFVSIRAI